LMRGDQGAHLDAYASGLYEGRVQQWASGHGMDGKSEIAVFRSERGTGKTIVDMGA